MRSMAASTWCSSANAVWVFDNNYPKSNMESALFTSTTDIYRFGAFQGKMKSGDGRRKVEFGGRSDVQTIVTLKNRHNSSGARRGGFEVTKIGNGDRALAVPVGRNGGDRIIRTVGGPACTAKSRYELPEELPLVFDEFKKALEKGENNNGDSQL